MSLFLKISLIINYKSLLILRRILHLPSDYPDKM